ncbi:MAG: transketolase, partial [Acidobacteriota bacterium]|nr:transketolase [Acidobacteriota bacterium]
MSVAVDSQLARQAVQTIKFLSTDAVQRANSGHPGLPMGAADIAWVLWSRYLRYDPRTPDWPDRDRFVLSAGHGCMLLYAMLHLSGYDLSMDDLKAFRQWESKTPGHPEFGHTVGVEATTGPLGQGISNAVGMAIAARMLRDRVSPNSGDDLVGHRVFTLCSDGDVMEGVSGETCSLAGHLGLGNLIALYDDNHISIEGPTELAFSEDVCARYAAYGWDVQRIDGHDHDAIAGAIDHALGQKDRPSLIACRTHIAHGSPNKQDSADAHGSPLGEDEIKATKAAAGWPLEPAFHVPEEVRSFFRSRAEEGAALRTAWVRKFEAWVGREKGHRKRWDQCWQPEAPKGLTDRLIAAAPTDAGATRAHSGKVLQVAAAEMPGLVGGSADLAPSNKSTINDSPAISPADFSGRNFHFGVREHAMGAIVNGMLYHGAFRPYGATFLVFSDYMRPTLRLAALAKLPAIHIFTHDSIFVGEDGPTHQPVEHAWVLRMIPGLDVFRPADGVETALCWGLALEATDQPSVLLLTRQKLPPLDRQRTGALADMRRGAYLVAGDDQPDAVIAATGSEVHLAVAAREAMASEGKKINVVSIPCYERFRAQGPVYAQRLFPGGVPVATIEA